MAKIFIQSTVKYRLMILTIYLVYYFNYLFLFYNINNFSLAHDETRLYHHHNN